MDMGMPRGNCASVRSSRWSGCTCEIHSASASAASSPTSCTSGGQWWVALQSIGSTYQGSTSRVRPPLRMRIEAWPIISTRVSSLAWLMASCRVAARAVARWRGAWNNIVGAIRGHPADRRPGPPAANRAGIVRRRPNAQERSLATDLSVLITVDVGPAGAVSGHEHERDGDWTRAARGVDVLREALAALEDELGTALPATWFVRADAIVARQLGDRCALVRRLAPVL